MHQSASQLDRRLIALFQGVYDTLLDRFGTRIGTYRMALAVTPILVDFARRLATSPLIQVGPTAMFLLILFMMFYDFGTMATDNRLQSRNDLRLINLETISFERKSFYTRVFYLLFFGCSALLFYDLAGLGLLAIVYARCVKVRERIERDYYASFALGSR